jgi:hypothetical protein
MLVAGGIGDLFCGTRERSGCGRMEHRPQFQHPINDFLPVSLCWRAFSGISCRTGRLRDSDSTCAATDDGSRGHHGFVTALLEESLKGNDRPGAVYVCGPEPMMHAAAKLCERHDVDCWLSLESPMACGFGACFSCVTRVRQPEGGWDYRRTCVEGPVFRACDLVL